ncbi:MAG: alpha/beta hydrolase [Solirubrobacteraceae bacterium]
MVREITGDGVTLAVQDEGEGPPVLLIHGFPDSHRLWRHQVPALAAAGKRVIAPDLRGLGESEKPADVADYGIRHSIADMLAVLDALGVERAQVVGHDFGAAVAWGLAAFAPERVDRLAVLSVAHPRTLAEPTVEQREKAWYMLLFQFAGVAEEMLQRDDWRLLREWLRGNGDVEHYIADLSRPGALTAGLNWYRANAAPARQLRERSGFPTVTVPTLGIWSSGDDYLLEAPMATSGEHVEGEWRYERIEGASHWMQLDEPERLNELLLGFLT